MENRSKELRAFLKKLGREIYMRRKQLNISQAELAEKADISVTYVSKIECGHKNISAYMLLKIMSALNITYIKSSELLYINDSLYKTINEITNKLNNEQVEYTLRILQLLSKIIDKKYT